MTRQSLFGVERVVPHTFRNETANVLIFFFWNIFRYRVKNNWIRSKKYHLEEKKKEILVRNYLEKNLLEFKLFSLCN